MDMDNFESPNITEEEYELACKEKFALDNITYERVIFYLQTGRHVSGLTRAERKHIWKKSSLFQWDVLKKILYYKRPKDIRRRQVIRSVDELASILKFHHNSITSGHSGIQATFEKISRIYYWRSMMKDVRHYIAKCSECQRFNPVKTQAPPLQSIKVKELWELNGVGMIDGGGPPLPPPLPSLSGLEEVVIEKVEEKDVSLVECRSKQEIITANLHVGTQDTSSSSSSSTSEVPISANTSPADQSIPKREEEPQEDCAQRSGPTGASTLPAVGKTLLLVDEGDASHLAKKRRLEIQVLEAQLRVLHAQELYYTKKNKLLDKDQS